MKTMFNEETKRTDWIVSAWWEKCIFVGGVAFWIFFAIGFFGEIFNNL